MTCCSVSVRAESFSSAADRWEELIAASRRATIFDLPVWQRTWWEHFGSGKQERILAVCSDDRSIDLLAPLMQKGDTVSFLGGTDLVDYHDFICPSEPPEACIDAVLREISSDSSVGRMLFESISEGSQTLEVLPEVARGLGWETAVQKEDVSPRLELAGDWDQYLSGLRKKDRHELRRKLRRLEKSGQVSHVELSGSEDVETGLSDFFRLHRMSMPDKEEFMTPERERFFRDVAVKLAGRGITRLSFLELDGQKVATSLSFVLGDTRYLYNSGYDPDYRREAVGLLNHAYTIQKSIEQGHAVFDFMRGDEPYKYHLGGVDRDIYRITAVR